MSYSPACSGIEGRLAAHMATTVAPSASAHAPPRRYPLPPTFLQGEGAGCLAAKVPKLARMNTVENATRAVATIVRSALRPTLAVGPQNDSLCVHLAVTKPYLLLNGTRCDAGVGSASAGTGVRGRSCLCSGRTSWLRFAVWSKLHVCGRKGANVFLLDALSYDWCWHLPFQCELSTPPPALGQLADQELHSSQHLCSPLLPAQSGASDHRCGQGAALRARDCAAGGTDCRPAGALCGAAPADRGRLDGAVAGASSGAGGAGCAQQSQRPRRLSCGLHACN